METKYYSHNARHVIAEISEGIIVVTDRHNKETQTGKFNQNALSELRQISKETYCVLKKVK